MGCFSPELSNKLFCVFLRKKFGPPVNNKAHLFKMGSFIELSVFTSGLTESVFAITLSFLVVATMVCAESFAETSVVCSGGLATMFVVVENGKGIDPI